MYVKKQLYQGKIRLFPRSKIILIMKMQFLLIFGFIMQSYAGVTQIQNQRMNLTFSNTTLKEVFQTIEDESNYSFIYKDEMINNGSKVSGTFKNKLITEVLDKVLNEESLSYTVKGMAIVIMPKNGELYSAISQQQAIKGKVTDSNGLPLPGVTVLIKGTTTGTVTDVNGNYSISGISNNALLSFSFVGMKRQEVSVNGKSTVNIVMEDESFGLDEVVAIGYGVSKKSDLTGSITPVAVDDISRQPISNVGELLRGKSTGVQVTQQNAAPGAGVKMRIRGANSINGNNDPLYVIDGFVGGDFNSLNVNDIESISILKDASATSLYGSRGSNGVVVITTKHAKSGENKIEYNAFVSFDQASKTLDVLNAEQFMTVANDRQSLIGANPFFTSSEISAAGEGTDWQDEILRTSISKTHQLSFTGNKGGTNYYISGSYQDQDGIVLNSYYKKYGFKTNLDSKLKDNFKVSMNVNGAYKNARNNSTYDGRNSPMGQALIFPASVSIKDADGAYNTSPAGYGPIAGNPVFNTYDGTEAGNNSYAMTILANLRADWDIVKNLKLSVSGGVDMFSTKYTGQTLPTKDEAVTNAVASVSDAMGMTWQNTNQLTYTNTFNDVHKLSATVVYEQQKYINRGLGGYCTAFPTLALGVNALQLASSQTTNSSYTQWSLQSYLGRANYTYNDKYMATVSMRVDGSSKFSDGNKYGYFPSAALAWRLSDEDFIKSMDVFQNLKLRGSFGKVGSQAINPYSTLQTLTFGSSQGNNYYFNNDATVSVGISPSSPANKDLKWETTQQWNVGVDVGVFDGNLSATVDYYHKKTTDLLVYVTVPSFLYGGSQLQNVGSMQNTGLEFSLKGILLNNNDWFISTGANISFNRNKVLDLGDQDQIFVSTRSGWTSYSSYSILQKDKPLGQMYGYTYLGTWKSGEAAEAAKYGNVPGDSKYLDIDKNYSIDGEDMKVIGKGLPQYTWSWNLDMSYKNFDLNVLVNGVQGNDVWNFTRFIYEGQNGDVTVPTSTAMLNRWSTSNESSNIPTFSTTNIDEKQSSRWIEDGSYVRLSNVTLGYTFDHLLKGTFIHNAKVFISGQNLLTITDYSGYNPEASVSGSGQDSAIGYDSAGYPALRSYVIGVKLSF